jgi:perosamine synthetase
MNRPIAIGLSPNTQSDDVAKAWQQILKPWEYQQGSSIQKVEHWFENYLKTSSAVSFSNARSALFVILQSLGIGSGDEVIIQAFTCVVVPNPIIATGAVPVYADINTSLILDVKKLEKKITKKTKAIIVQHTFGIPTDMDAIEKIAKKYNLFVIEDVAHTIGGEYKGKKLGTFGDAAIFSLGRDKSFSSVFGGIAITNNKTLGEKIRKFQQEKKYPSLFWIKQQLFHPIAFSWILPLYNFGIGKLLLVVLQKLHALSFPVSSKEKDGIFNPSKIKRFPNALASLALTQLQKEKNYNARRKEIVARYKKVCDELFIEYVSTADTQNLLRFPIFVDNALAMKMYFKKKGIYLGDWYANVVDPKGSDFEKVYYTKGSCPTAELLAKKISNLPTYPVMSDGDVEKVIDVLKSYCHSEASSRRIS